MPVAESRKHPRFFRMCSRHLIAPINLLRARTNCMQLFDLILAIRLCQSIERFISLARLAREFFISHFNLFIHVCGCFLLITFSAFVFI